MKLLVISDIVFDSIKIEIQKNSNYEVESLYVDDLLAYLINFRISWQEYSFDYLLVYSDQLFHKKPIEWQKKLLDLVFNISTLMKEKKIIISNLFNNSFNATSYNQSIGEAHNYIDTYDVELKKIKSSSNIFVFDAYKSIFNIGKNNCYNYALGLLYQMPYKKNIISDFSLEIVSLLHFINNEEKKVIVLDCDNTLWKGVIGEDGWQSVKCDKNADGLLFFHFQAFLKAKKEEGFLLTLCSKNNEEDVKSFFQNRSTPLSWEDFVVKKINWKDKHENIRDIAKTLNVGMDSFIFIDDNPFEISTIIHFLPDVFCIEFKDSCANFEKMIENKIFRRKNITASDKKKTQLYEEETQRKEIENSFENFDDFIEQLEIKTAILLNDLNDTDRLAQLTGKTNQFNFNKVSYTKEQLEQFIDNNGFVFSLKVSDKFGDYGTVGLILAKIINDKEVVLENFLMSCRALGKRIENDFFEYVINFFEKKSLHLTEIIFRKTEKNIPAETFLNNTYYGNIIRRII